MSEDRFQIDTIDKSEKDIFIYGPDELLITVNFDDVDHDEVEAAARKMVDILNTHW